MSMTTPRVTVPVEPTALSVCRAIAPYLGATDLNDWSGLEDDDAISMPVKMRVGDLRDLKAVISAAPAPEGGAVDREIARMREAARDWRRPALQQVEGPNDLKIYGGTIADDIDRWADMMAALATREEAHNAFAFDGAGNVIHSAFIDGSSLTFDPVTGIVSTREEAPAEAGEIGDTLFRALRSYKLTNMACEDDPSIGYPLVDLMSNDGTDVLTGEEEMRVLADHLSEALRAQPPAREDAQPVAGEGLPVAWVIRTKDGHIRMWTMSEARARTAAAAWGMEAKQEGLSPITHHAPDALRVAVEALTVARSQAERGADKAGCDGWRSQEMCRQVVPLIDQALAALQAEQKGGA